MPWNLCSLSQFVSVRLFKWQYIRLNWKVNRKFRRQGRNDKRVMQRLYRMIQLAISRKNEGIAYRTIELLKLAFGEKLMFSDESGRLMHVCVLAVQEKQYGIVGYLLDAYRPLLRNASNQAIGQIIKDLILLFNIVKVARQEYILEKLVKNIFVGVLRLATDSGADYSIGVDALKLIGLNAIKQHDLSLFQEAVKNILAFSLVGENQTRLHILLIVWLHQLIKRDDQLLLPEFFRLVEGLLCDEQLAAGVTVAIIAESDNFVGMIGVNQHMRCNLTVLLFLLKLAHGSADNMQRVAHSIGQMVKLAIVLYGTRQGFTLLLPLLEVGRLCLDEELQFMKSSDEIRPKKLFMIIREIVLLLKIVARQDGKIMPVDLLLTIHQYWRGDYLKAVNRHSVDRFCQLILQQISQGRRNKQRNIGLDRPELLQRNLFALEQRQKLNSGLNFAI